jgi:hypothetical protein
MLLKENAKQIAGKAPVDGAFLEHAIEVGNALRGTGSRRMKKQSAAVKGQMEDRDKVYTLIATEYEKARRAAAYLVGVDELDKFVPPLGSRTITRHKAKAKDEAVAAPAVAAQTTTTPAASDKPALAVAKVAA